LHCSEKENQLSKILPRDRGVLQVKAVVTDAHKHAEILPWSDSRSPLTLKLLAVRQQGHWRRIQGTVLCRRESRDFAYGDVITGYCRLERIRTRESAGVFGYERYLQKRGISHFGYLQDELTVQTAQSWRRFSKTLYHWRDLAIARMSKGIKREENRQMLASMFFGYRGLLDPHEKEVFRRSGTVHLFAVSGLHMGICAALLLGALQLTGLNLARRSLILPVLLVIYLFMTGAPPSAIRAYVMISVWSIARGLKLPANGLNNIAFSAFLLLFFNPLNLLSAGFLYTFGITSALVLTYRRSLSLFQTLGEKHFWYPPLRLHNSTSLKVFLLFSCSLTACFASFGLNLLINQLLSPLAFLTNSAAAILAWLNFCAAGVNLICGVDGIYTIQEKLLESMRFVVEQGDISWRATAPHPAAALAYYLGFFGFLTARGKKSRRACALLCITLCCMLSQAPAATSVSWSVNASSNIPDVLIEQQGRLTLINCASFKTPALCRNRVVDLLILPATTADYSRFLEALLTQAEVKQIYFRGRPTRRVRGILRKCDFRGPCGELPLQPFQSCTLQKSEQNCTVSFQTKCPGDSRFHIQIYREIHGATRLKIAFGTAGTEQKIRRLIMHSDTDAFQPKIDF
jgi:ComEC/Rec2-related protein